MDNIEIENKIRSSFSDATPNVLDRIKESCRMEGQVAADEDMLGAAHRKSRSLRPTVIRYAAIAASFVIIFVVGLLIGNVGGNGTDSPMPQLEYASVYIDVNPSIEIVVDDTGAVASVKAANTDAEKLLADMDLTGVNVKTALSAVIGALYMNGYFGADENSMLVSVGETHNEKFTNLLSDVVSDVNEIIENTGITCSLVAQDVVADDALAELASTNNISVGKMSLINKIIEMDDSYTKDDIADLAKSKIKDLNEIYAFYSGKGNGDNPGNGGNNGDNGNHGNNGNGNPGHNDIISGVLDWLDKDKQNALDAALKSISEQLDITVSQEGITDLDISVKCESVRGEHGFGIKYIYTISFTYNGERYSFDVDSNGKITDTGNGDSPNRDENTDSDRDKHNGATERDDPIGGIIDGIVGGNIGPDKDRP